jgi:hypothetical protein
LFLQPWQVNSVQYFYLMFVHNMAMLDTTKMRNHKRIKCTSNQLSSTVKSVNSSLLNSTKPVNSNMSFATGFAFPYDNVPLNSTPLQIALPFLCSQEQILFAGFTVLQQFRPI